MKKISSKLLIFFIRKNRKISENQKRLAISRKHRKNNVSNYKKENQRIRASIYEIKEKRFNLKKKLFEGFNYPEGESIISVKNEFGIEEVDSRKYFLTIASRVIDFNVSKLEINLSDCTRIWPSGVTLLCSLIHWVYFNVSSRGLKKRPTIISSDSKKSEVNSYLTHCGFHDYVGRVDKPNDHIFSVENVVKIILETKIGNEEVREREIMSLFRKYTKYSPDEVELFDSKVLTELFANVTEHGITMRHRGWWVLAQYHSTHNIISLNIADNGIGFRHSLMTGPQKDELSRIYVNDKKNDGRFIQMALEQNVSGAFDASIKEGILIKDYKRGARRGNGLARIKKTCAELGIKLSILSHYGYAFCDEKSNVVESGSMDSRVFGGTLYHFCIPCS